MVLLLLLNGGIFAQNPYILVGSATQDDCHCYTLTDENYFEAGAVWNKNQLDLSQPFDYSFQVYLGCADTSGADGIAFVLQSSDSGVGNVGAGLGFQEITPSIGITIDTYQNGVQDDPAYDHVAIQADGNTFHHSDYNLVGPVPVFADSGNIEDCNWHVLEISWDPDANLIEVSIDGDLRLSLTKDIIQDIFSNNSIVYWGFTASTGTNFNIQKFCAPLAAKFVIAPYDNTCVGTSFTFTDSSTSYGSISNWYWDFGDGDTSELQTSQSHAYSEPGTYNITLSIKGGDGCLSDTFTQTITIGAYPDADFTMSVSPVCTKDTVVFTDATVLSGGTVNYWYWDFGNGATSNLQQPPAVHYDAGDYTVKLFVNTEENCPSDTAEKSFTVGYSPEIDFTKTDTCNNIPIQFTAANLQPDIVIANWYWDFGDNTVSNDSAVLHTYKNGGIYEASLAAQAENGCYADTVVKTVQIYSSNANAGNDTTILLGEPFQLQGSGGEYYSWSPSTGLSDPDIANPIATLYEDMTYTLTVTTAKGCATSDAINLKVFEGPEIYIPSAFTPNGDGLNDAFKMTPVGIKQILYFKVMNRWGQVMYASKSASAAWDGTLNGIPQAAGTYIWMVAGITASGTAFRKQGTVVLIR
ncbi:lectin-like domain-containing protein [Parafilimonas sp.]|uniref:lectin-like domain-containing protein n=1 Tax=Parafilimonas sp. TaxID=1969739 RepID=UPI0039E69851